MTAQVSPLSDSSHSKQSTDPRTRAQKTTPQFDIRQALEKRPFERALLTHHGLHQLVTWIGRIALTAMVWPRFVAPYRLRVNHFAMPLPGLHPDFVGYKILFLSDLHTGKTRQSFLRRVVGTVEEQRPDLILLGGDLIDYHPRSLPLLAELLPWLKAPDGTYAIFGNHDYHEYSWRHIGPRSAKRVIHRRLVAMLADSPVRLLRNEHVTISRGTAGADGKGGGRLQIVGMDEMWCDRFDPATAFAPDGAGRALDAAVPTICLQHNPDGFEYLLKYPWDWMLCGHSHGGQVDVPMIGPIYVPMVHRNMLRGFFEMPGREGAVGGRKMFVSTGVGHSKPLRFRVPPEVTVFTLGAEESAAPRHD